jgi:hypothetical protein
MTTEVLVSTGEEPVGTKEVLIHYRFWLCAAKPFAIIRVNSRTGSDKESYA